MIAFFDYIIDLCDKLLSLMASERVAAVLGVPFIYVLISFFVVWIVTNIFIIRPMVGGLFFDRGVRVNNKPSKPDTITSYRSNFRGDQGEYKQ